MRRPWPRSAPASSASTTRNGKHLRVFVRGGFADVHPLGLTILAETAIPFEELNAAHLDQEIKNAEEDVADATEDQKQAAQEKLDRLRELKELDEALKRRGSATLGCRPAPAFPMRAILSSGPTPA